MDSSHLHHKAAILVILALTYAGIALGHVPGLKLNRTGIAMLDVGRHRHDYFRWRNDR
jgi:hypothetical protein